MATNPATGLAFLVEPSSGGQSSTLRLMGVYWGRLVDVQDANGTLLLRDYVVGEDIKTNGVDYQLDRNPVTGVETLTILHAQGTAGFDAAFGRLESNVTNVLDKSLELNELPPFTMVARNSALVLRFNDLLDDGGNPGSNAYPGTVKPETIQFYTGTPPTVPYELRILPDPNHGDLVGGVFHSTRVILDLTVSSLEAQQAGLNVNSLGLPGATVATQPNLGIRIPTIPNPAAAQFEVLESLSGTRLSFNGSGSNDPFSPTLDVVRAARSGGSTLGDPNNGFLVDEIDPEILGVMAATLTVTSSTGSNQFLGDVVFGSKQCAVTPRVNDVIEVPNYTLQVTEAGNNPVNGKVTNVAFEVLVGNPAALVPPFVTVGQYSTTWDPAGGALPECFVRYSPAAKTPPSTGVQVQADVVVSFSEPMDPASVQAFQSFELEYGTSPNPGNPLYRRVVGNVIPAADLLDFTLEPSHPLKHNPGPTPETYRFTVKSGVLGVTDLAGNQLVNTLPQISFTIDPAQPAVDSGGVALDFSSADEDLNGGPEIRGQFLQDLILGRINPRPVARFSAPVDPTQPMIANMTDLPTANIQTPLSNLGSRTQLVWRYCDMGFALLDDSNHNLDVEGLWWEPFDGTPHLDNFPEFEIRLGHSAQFPDENVDNNLLPTNAQSGVFNQFDKNYADAVNLFVEEPPAVVHPKGEGYQVQPITTISQTGRKIAAWPMNVGKPLEEFVYWTWRDTAKLMLGADKGVGVDPDIVVAVLTASNALKSFYPLKKVPTIGLPMLLEFRTYPSTQANGQNGFRIAIAINSSSNPFFRVFSTGGVLSGQTILVDPDNAATGTGGIDPILNVATPSRDPAVYYGQADFVVRVSRFHTIWLDTLVSGSALVPAVVEPRSDAYPSGTQVVLAFRGASALAKTGVTNEPWKNANFFDPYGDPISSNNWTAKLKLPDSSFTVTEFPTDGDLKWRTSPTQLTGARYVQMRVSMISNATSGLSPWVSGLGLSYLR